MVLVEDGVEGAPQTTRFEITGEVRFTVSADGGDILVTAKPIANPFRIVASDDVAVGPVAASVTGRDAEIAAKRRQIEEIEADQAHIWKNGETGETVRQERFKKLGEPFEYEGEGYADPDAPEEIARLEQEIAALESGQAGSEPETGGEPAAETDATTSLTPEPGPGDAGGGARSASTNFDSTGPGSAQSGPIISLDSDLYNADKPVEVRFRVPEEGG